MHFCIRYMKLLLITHLTITIRGKNEAIHTNTSEKNNQTGEN